MVFLSELRNMFWGVTIDGGKRYSQIVESSFHISMAALEPSSVKEKGVVSILIQHEKAEFLLCTLENGRLPQQPLDLNFTEGEEVTFFLSGPGIVHLTGFLLDDDNNFEDSLRELPSEDSMEESDEEEAPELEPISLKNTSKKDKKRKLPDPQLKGVKKKKVEDSEESEEDSEDEYESFLNEDMEEDEETSEEDGDRSETLADVFEDDDEESEEDDEVKITKAAPSNKLTKTEKKEKRKSQEGTKQENTPKKSQNTQEASTPGTNNLEASGDASTKKKKKKKKKKKAMDDENVIKQGENTPKTKTIDQQIPKKKVVAGGTVVEELKTGHGPEAKPGKMAHMYYTGKLANNGKQFDACISGKPFKFRLGKNEVIKGWENGVNGMKVGGKRRLTVPAQQGYGSQRQGPIPANSTLVFDIELKAIS